MTSNSNQQFSLASKDLRHSSDIIQYATFIFRNYAMSSLYIQSLKAKSLVSSYTQSLPHKKQTKCQNLELLQCYSVATPQTDETRWRNINIIGGSPTKSQTLSCIQHGEEPISTPHCVLLTPIGGGINKLVVI